jgi:hypothetical protein
MWPPLWFAYGWAMVMIRRRVDRSARSGSDAETRYSLIAVPPLIFVKLT